jgi:AcrR family transcriptional regulator
MPKVISEEKIYQATIQTVIERGYANAKTKQIAKAADISEVTLFRKFGTKAELVSQAFLFMMQKVDFDTMASYTGDIFVDLLRIVEAYQGRNNKEGHFFYPLLIEVQRHPELAGLLETPIELFGTIGKLLTRYQEEGILIKEHPFHALAGLVGPLMAINIIRTAATHTEIPPADLERHVRFFITGRRA